MKKVHQTDLKYNGSSINQTDYYKLLMFFKIIGTQKPGQDKEIPRAQVVFKPKLSLKHYILH